MPRIAILGVSHIHTNSFANQLIERKASMGGVWDPDVALASKFAETLGTSVRTVEDILGDPEVGAVIVCSQTHLHAQLVPAICGSGKAAFIEKPLGMAEADAVAMGDMLKSAGTPFSTGYFSRGDRRWRTVKKWMEEGKFGKVTRMRFSNCHCGALQGWFDGEWRWMADLSQAGVGAFGDLGTHGLDILMWLGGPVKEAVGYRSTGTARYGDCDETGEAILRFENGIIATLAAAWDDWNDPVSFFVSGTEGSCWMVEGKLHAKFGETTGEVDENELEPMAPAGFSGFLDFCEGKEVDLVPIEDAVSRCVVMDWIYRSSACGSTS